MNLSTEIRDCVLLFHDKTYKFITKTQEDAFYAQSVTIAKGIKIDGKFVAFSSVSRTMELEDFYMSYPEHRPEAPRDTFKELYGDVNQQIRYPVKDALDLMKKGFIQFKMYGNPEYTRNHEALKVLPERMIHAEAEAEFVDFMKSRV
jgi:hypothetical protein